MTIPTEIEKDIKTGKARYQTFQTGIGGQSVLKINPNSYIIIFGYDFSPAGGGWQVTQSVPTVPGGQTSLYSNVIAPFATQQIAFYTGQAFHPFVHHVPIDSESYVYETSGTPTTTSLIHSQQSVDQTPIQRGVYVVAQQNVSIEVGLMEVIDPTIINPVTFAPIEVTQNTPAAVSYGGDTNDHPVQTILSNAAGSVFTQPSVEQNDFYGTGVAPAANVENQVYLKPEPGSVASGIGLMDPADYIRTRINPSFIELYGVHYFLNVHYALYTNQTPEQLG